MRASDLSPVPGSVHKRKRVGRGNASGHGTSATRGTKGQQSRTGYSRRLGFEGGQNPLIRALSRKRGFNNRFRVEYEPVNLSDLAQFPAGTSVTSASLREAGLVKSARMPVKILGDGELSVSLNVEAERFSASARAKIEAAGGKVVETAPREEKKERKGARARSGAGRTAAASTAPNSESEPESETESEA
jgi:large subunit ribosomal protein L15